MYCCRRVLPELGETTVGQEVVEDRYIGLGLAVDVDGVVDLGVDADEIMRRVGAERSCAAVLCVLGILNIAFEILGDLQRAIIGVGSVEARKGVKISALVLKSASCSMTKLVSRGAWTLLVISR